jgi:hypothetical protein
MEIDCSQPESLSIDATVKFVLDMQGTANDRQLDGDSHTSLVFTMKEEVGALSKALVIFEVTFLLWVYRVNLFVHKKHGSLSFHTLALIVPLRHLRYT